VQAQLPGRRRHQWSTTVVHTGGGDYNYGKDTTGETDLFTTITVRAGDPYFTCREPDPQLDQGC
jgi:hypothetical protein